MTVEAAVSSRPVRARRMPLIAVTPEMLAAGRRAFKRERSNLNDLYDCFECDLDQFIVAIYRSMQATC